MLVMSNTAADKNSPIATLLAIASHDVTVAEFLLFREKHGVNRSSAPTDDCPDNLVSGTMLRNTVTAQSAGRDS